MSFYQEGFEAYGQTRTCPYDRLTAAYSQWCEGWSKAMIQRWSR